VSDPARHRAAAVRAIAEGLAREPGALLPVLHAVQDELGHLERADVVAIADVLNLSVADVHGVVTFYHDFRTEPAAAHQIRLCRAEACQSVGAEPLYAETTRRFAAHPDVEVTEVFCLGNCALGPSGTVDGALHGRLDASRVTALTAGWGR
jgi:formate dehydrogenase subunit gamma